MVRKSLMALTVGVAVLWSVSAAAELTLQEKAQVRRMVADVLYRHESAAITLADALRQTTPAIRADLGTAWAKWWTAEWLLNRSIAFLIHANPEQADAAQYWRNQPVTEWVAAAWRAQDAALLNIDATKAALARAKAQPGLAPSLTSALTQTISWLSSAQFYLRAVDRTLPYADPYPANYPRIIGPHGHWDETMNLLAMALAGVAAAELTLGKLYAGPVAFPDYTPFKPGFFMGVGVTQKYRHGWLSFATIPITDAECELNPFHLVASAFGPLASHTSESHGVGGGPYAFQVSLLGVLGPLFDAAHADGVARAQLVRFVHDWTGSWRLGDGAMWRALMFPDDVTLAELRQQGFAEADPFGPPLCDG